MGHENDQGKRHGEGIPPAQETGLSVLEWMQGLQSIDQSLTDASELRAFMGHQNSKRDPVDPEFEFH